MKRLFLLFLCLDFSLIIGSAQAPEQVDDLAQETFIRVYKYLHSYKANAKFSTWLYRIAYNVFLDAVKQTDQYRALKAHETVRSFNPGALVLQSGLHFFAL